LSRKAVLVSLTYLLPAGHDEYIKIGKGDDLRKRCRSEGFLYRIPERFVINEKWVRL
jgi:hypothetical protein